MAEREARKKDSRFGREITDIAAGIVIVIFSVLVFLNPEANGFLFPVIFLMGAGMSLANGLDRMPAGDRRKRRPGGIPLLCAAAALFLMALFSAASILWG